jgi:hypothetical protein
MIWDKLHYVVVNTKFRVCGQRTHIKALRNEGRETFFPSNGILQIVVHVMVHLPQILLVYQTSQIKGMRWIGTITRHLDNQNALICI